jgi:hypothetical protein
MMTIAAVIAAAIGIQRHDTAYVLIAIRQANTPLIAITGW